MGPMVVARLHCRVHASCISKVSKKTVMVVVAVNRPCCLPTCLALLCCETCWKMWAPASLSGVVGAVLLKDAAE